MWSLSQLVSLVLAVTVVRGKVYERCELAKELKEVHEAPDHQLATWVCIAEHESQYNTSAVGHLNGDGSGDHGLFQISDLFWCSPPGNGWACGVTCAQLEDDDIEDDFVCARRVYREHKRLSGDGFNAWAVYQPHCAGSLTAKYIEGCFDASKTVETSTKVSTTTTSTTTTTPLARTTARRLHNKIKKDPVSRFIFNKVPWV